MVVVDIRGKVHKRGRVILYPKIFAADDFCSEDATASVLQGNHKPEGRQAMDVIGRRRFVTICALFLLFSQSSSAHAEDFGTADQAKAMVDRVAAFFKANGKDKTLAELSNPKGQFIDRDLYVIAYSLEGVRLAHPYNPKLIGMSVLDAVDFDGKAYGKDILAVAKTKGSGWVDYKFTDPATKKLADKSLYVVKVDDLIFGCGIYKR